MFTHIITLGGVQPIVLGYALQTSAISMSNFTQSKKMHICQHNDGRTRDGQKHIFTLFSQVLLHVCSHHNDNVYACISIMWAVRYSKFIKEQII